MDRSLQERLVGAAVLVTLGVWLIPWILDGSAVSEPEQAEQARIQLPVPERSQRVPVRRETIELGGTRNPGLKAAAEQSERGSAVPAKQALDSPDDTAQDGTTPVETTAAPAAISNADTTEDTGADTADGASAEQAQAAVTEREPASEPESSGRDSVAEILAASPVAGWMVQLGSFSDESNARRQAQQISTYGHEAHIYRFAAGSGRTMFRVRLGPVESRERAQEAASALSAQGFVAQLVAPE
jgi:DedD protein